MSLPKRYEFVESCLQQLIIHVMVVGLCMDAVAHSRERVGLPGDRAFFPVLAMLSLWMGGLPWLCCVYFSE